MSLDSFQNCVVGRVTSNRIVGRMTSNRVIGRVTSNRVIWCVTSNRVVGRVTPNCIVRRVTPTCIVRCISLVPHRCKCIPRSNRVPQAFLVHSFWSPLLSTWNWMNNNNFGMVKDKSPPTQKRFSLQSWQSHATGWQGAQDVQRDVRCR